MATRAARKTTSRKRATKTKASSKKTAARKTKSKNASSVSTKKRSGTKKREKASGLRIRMYRVGFGDFFLVIVPTRAGDRYIVIDCGVFKGTSGTGDIGSIEEAVEDLFKTTGGALALVIMTHRHADHIAGFSRAERFKDFTASMVWMPYWEQFNDAKDSPHNLQFDLGELAFQLAMQFRGRTDDVAQEAFAQLENATGIDFNATATGKKKVGGNAAALDLLKNRLGNNGKNVRYYAAGDAPELPPELEGLSAAILGPPPKDAKAFMALTDLKQGVGQYLDSRTSDDQGTRAIQPFPDEFLAEPDHDYPQKDVQGFAVDYKAIVNNVDVSQPDMLAAAAGKIETFLNNQSLVVLFKFAGKNLLFVGDAQAGNWEHWLYKLDAPVKDPTKAGAITEDSRELLQTIDFYKVGHHGSTNATPIQVVDALATNHSANSFVSMCSTEFGVYGNVNKGTEVPRAPLMKALSGECVLLRSDSIEITTKSRGVIKAVKGSPAGLPSPKVGKLTRKALYVEYSF